MNATITEKRTGAGAEIESAFVKQPIYEGLLIIGQSPKSMHKDQLIKIRLEVDKSNPQGAEEEHRLIKLPTPFLIKTLTLPSLFAGKLHAIIARSYMNRVKGRDYFDLQYYLARDTPVNLRYLEAKLRDSGHYMDQNPLDVSKLIIMLKSKFRSVDFKKAALDVTPFLHVEDLHQVEEWSSELFCALIETLKASSAIHSRVHSPEV